MTDKEPTLTESASAAHDAAPADELTGLRSRLAEAEQLAATARDAQLRALAELENVRKRAEREIDSNRKYGTERILGDLLSVADSLDLGLAAASAPAAGAKPIAEGMQLIHKQLLSFFEKHGVKPVDPQGQPFDPQFHEAVSMLPSAEVPANHVLKVMQKGYRLHERLLRPAMVVVASAPANAAAHAPTDAS